MGEIRTNQKAKLAFKVAGSSEKEIECRIKDAYSDRISLKFSKEILSYARYLQEGAEVSVKIFTPAGIKVFDAMILNSPLESEFVIEYVEDSEEIQRREYTRCQLETKIIIERQNAGNIIARTVDIGGGGIRFFCEEKFEEEENASCLLYLPLQISSIKADGKIVYKPHLKQNEHLLLFEKITAGDRDKIVKKCFELEPQIYDKR